MWLLSLADSDRPTNFGQSFDFLLFRLTTYFFARFRWKKSEVKREQLAILMKEKEKELLAKDYKIKQARKIVEDETKNRKQAECQRDALAKQLRMLKDVIMIGGVKTLDNDTLKKVQHIDSAASQISPPRHEYPRNTNVIEESIESILDVSDLSFDETRDDIYNKRRSSGKVDLAYKRRKTRSTGNQLEDRVLSTTTKVTVDKKGVAHAESIIEAVPVTELKRKVRKSRESRGEKKISYDINFQREFEPSAPPCSSMMILNNPNSPAKTIVSRPHIWETKKGMPTRCGACSHRIQFNKEYFRCKDCQTVCHKGCKHNVRRIIRKCFIYL